MHVNTDNSLITDRRLAAASASKDYYHVIVAVIYYYIILYYITITITITITILYYIYIYIYIYKPDVYMYTPAVRRTNEDIHCATNAFELRHALPSFGWDRMALPCQ